MLFGIRLELWLVCIVVILGRIVDMSLATIRTVYSVKGKAMTAAIIGFAEAFFWFLVVKTALDMEELAAWQTIILAMAYSLGFALGTYLGGLFTRKFIKSPVKAEIVLSNKNEELITALQENGFGETILTAKGAKNKQETYLLFVETDTKQIKVLKQLLDQYDPHAFVSINESKSVFNGYFRSSK